MTTFQRATVDGLNLFYREAGSKTSPTIVLLHGFPSSSHMFRNLIPRLADRFHVIAPIRPANAIVSVTLPVSMIPVATGPR